MSASVQRDVSPLPPHTAVCLGAFDGLHQGHQALFDAAFTLAPRVAILTFDPHPMQILAPDRAPRLLQTSIQRRRVAAAMGVEHLVLLPFNTSFAQQSPEVFVRDVLTEGLRPSHVVVGNDFRFGAKRAGTPDALRTLLAPHHIPVEIVDPVLDEQSSDKISSTTIRQALDRGDVERAGALLGRWHSVAGSVVHGAKRGRLIGYPTANIDYGTGYLPPLGIYATTFSVWDRTSPDYGAVWPSVTSLGRNPTFVTNGSPTLESHILDRELGERLYGLDVEVAFVARLRSEQRFESVEALVAQMDRDAAQARSRLTSAVISRTIAPPERIAR